MGRKSWPKRSLVAYHSTFTADSTSQTKLQLQRAIVAMFEWLAVDGFDRSGSSRVVNRPSFRVATGIGPMLS